MNYNAVISVEDMSDESGVITEPITLQQVKDYLRLEGYTDMDASTADALSNFTYDDSLIRDIIIPAARKYFEENCGLSLVRKTLKAVITNQCGFIELPYGPIVSITSLKDCQGNTITSYQVVGNIWKNLVYPYGKNMAIEYQAGYVTLPIALKLDLLRLVAYMYENRGDDASVNAFASQLTSKWSRKTFIA